MALNPLQNALPKQQIPNEAPSFFSPFFEQPLPHAPGARLSIWQPPPPEVTRRSKAPINRPRAPPTIPTAGVLSPKPRVVPEEEKKGLFEPKQKKKSLDEIMWLGSVSGFPPPVPAVKVEASLRSKLVRKPEEKASQASAATGPKTTEAQRRKEEEEKAREKRLEQWATKKKAPSPSSPKQSQLKKSDGEAKEKKSMASSIFLPQPTETTSKTTRLVAQQGEQRVVGSGRRGKVFLPIPQPIDNRPSDFHRPNMPTGESSYAPDRPILPQPIEVVRKTNRPQKKTEQKKKSDEIQWMGLPTPIETVRRSNRKSPLSKVSGSEDKESGGGLLPQPVESSKRSNRPQKEQPVEAPKKGSLPQPIETSKESSRKSHLPQPIETSKRSNRPTPAPLQNIDKSEPPTPTTSFFGPSPTLPQPIETSRHSHRPISARPLLPQPIETSRRSNRSRVPPPEMEIDIGSLPQPISVSRWTNRRGDGRHLRRSSTSKPMTPEPVQVSRQRNKAGGESQKAKKMWMRPADHVSHLHEPIDSTPPSPAGSPDQSRCPSLSGSPTSSAASSTWELARAIRNGGIHGRRESLDEGFAGYILGLERGLKRDGAIGSAGQKRERQKEESEFPFPIVTEEKGSNEKNNTLCVETGSRAGGGSGRSESSETIRPKLRAVVTDPVLDKEPRQPDVDDYPICHSPVFDNFKRPEWQPETSDDDERKDTAVTKKARVPTGESEVTKSVGIPVSANNQLPTPPDSLASSVNKDIAPIQTMGPPPHSAPPRVAYSTMAPSPGYTVASLPPCKKKEHEEPEVNDEFVAAVWRYLSLEFESIASKYDEELASYSGLNPEDVKRDRKGALRRYLLRWVSENPDAETGETRKKGLW